MLADYVSQKKALDCLREQEIHRKKIRLLEIQISEAEYKEKIAMYLHENRKSKNTLLTNNNKRLIILNFTPQVIECPTNCLV